MNTFTKLFSMLNKSRQNLSAVALAILFLLLASNANAATRYSVATGNWNSTATWSATSGGASGASFPVAGDIVIMQGIWNVTININNAACSTLTLAPLNNNEVALLTFNAGSVLTVSGVVSLGEAGGNSHKGKIDMTLGGTLKCTGFALGNTGANDFVEGLGTVELTATNTLPASIFTAFNNLVISAGTTTVGSITADSLIFTATGAAIAVTGTSTIGTITLNSSLTTMSGSISGTGVLNAANVNVGTIITPSSNVTTTLSSNIANFNITSNINIKSSNSTSPTKTNNATFNQTGGIVLLNGSIITSNTASATSTFLLGSSSYLEFSGSSPFTLSGTGTNTITLNGASSTVEYSGAAQTVYTTTYINLILSGTGSKTMAAGTNSTNLTITGVQANLTGNSTATTLTLDGNVMPTGSWGSSSSAATHKNNTYFAGTGIVTVSGGSCTSGLWLGETSITWATTTNWCGGTVPTSSIDVVILPGTPFAPAISAAAATRNLTINSSTTLTISGAQTLSVNGNWTNNGTFVPSTGTVNFAGSVAQAIQGTSALNLNNLTISGSNTKTLGVNAMVSGNLALTAGTFSTSTFTLTVAGTISKTSGQIDASNGTIALTNTANYTMPVSTFSSTINNLIMNGAGGVVWSSAETITGTVTLTSGIISSDPNLFTFNAGSSYTGGNDNSYFDGPVKKIGNTAFTFPIGQADAFGGGYEPIDISAPVANGSVNDAYTAQYNRGNPYTIYGSGHVYPITNISHCEFWTLDKTTGSSTVNVTLHGNGNSGCSDFASGEPYFHGGGSTDNTLEVLHWNSSSSTWERAGSGVPTVVTPYPNLTLMAPSVSSFSPFTFGSSGANPVPVKMINFTAQASGNGALLNWATATEKNNDHFDIERSTDGKNFIKIGEVAGNGNTNNISKYSYIDANENNVKAPVFYYRLKQVDYNTVFEYTNIVSVNVSSKSTVAILNQYPNPFSNNVSINYNLPAGGNVNLIVTDQVGRVISSIETIANKGMNNMNINTADYPSGIYLISINFNGTNSGYLKMVKE